MKIIPKRDDNIYTFDTDGNGNFPKTTKYNFYYIRNIEKINKLYHYMKNKDFIQCYTSSSESGKIIMKNTVSILKIDYFDDNYNYSDSIHYYFYNIHSKYYDRNDIDFQFDDNNYNLIKIKVNTCNTNIMLHVREGKEYRYLEGEYFKFHENKSFVDIIQYIIELNKNDPKILYSIYKKLKKQIQNINTTFNNILNNPIITHNIPDHDPE